MDKLFTALKYSGTMTVSILIVQANQAKATEYVFSAPPEVDNNIVEEIPAQEADYPFYDCDTQALKQEEAEVTEDDDTKIDSHDCDCVDCEETTLQNEK